MASVLIHRRPRQIYGEIQKEKPHSFELVFISTLEISDVKETRGSNVQKLLLFRVGLFRYFKWA